MTPEEAIHVLERMLDEFYNEDSYAPECKDAVDMAIKALEKQIPNKPAERRDKYTGNYPMYCPNCGTYVAYRDGRTFVLSRFIGSSRCPECGQAIDFVE